MDLIAVAVTAALMAATEPARAIVVTATEGYRHESIETAEEVMAAIGERSGLFVPRFVRTAAEMPAALAPEELASAKLVMFVNTTGELEWPERQRLLDWVAGGGAFVGVHSAADTWHGWPEYLEMLGGEFASHPPETEVELFVDDRHHPSTSHLTEPRTIFEEIYLFDRFSRERVSMLLSLRAAPGSGEPGFFPLAWHRPYGQGKVFYTALGHRIDIWQAGWFQQHLEGAIESVLAGQAKRRAVGKR